MVAESRLREQAQVFPSWMVSVVTRRGYTWRPADGLSFLPARVSGLGRWNHVICALHTCARVYLVVSGKCSKSVVFLWQCFLDGMCFGGSAYYIYIYTVS